MREEHASDTLRKGRDCHSGGTRSWDRYLSLSTLLVPRFRIHGIAHELSLAQPSALRPAHWAVPAPPRPCSPLPAPALAGRSGLERCGQAAHRGSARSIRGADGLACGDGPQVRAAGGCRVKGSEEVGDAWGPLTCGCCPQVAQAPAAAPSGRAR